MAVRKHAAPLRSQVLWQRAQHAQDIFDALPGSVNQQVYVHAIQKCLSSRRAVVRVDGACGSSQSTRVKEKESIVFCSPCSHAIYQPPSRTPHPRATSSTDRTLPYAGPARPQSTALGVAGRRVHRPPHPKPLQPVTAASTGCLSAKGTAEEPRPQVALRLPPPLSRPHAQPQRPFNADAGPRARTRGASGCPQRGRAP